MTATVAASISPPRAAPDRWTDWDRFLESIPHAGFMQSSWWADFRTNSGYEYFGAILRDGPSIVGGALVMKYSYGDETFFYYIPDGPVLPEDESLAADVFEVVFETIEARRRQESDPISHLRIEPRWQTVPSFVQNFHARRCISDPYGEPRDTLCIDLRASESDILAQMKPKGRYNIKVAQRHGVTVQEDRSERGIEDFLAIYQDTAERQGFGAKPRDYFENLMAALFAADRGTVFFAEHEGKRVAVAVVIYFGPRATYFFGGSLPAYRQVMAPYLLHFEIMRRAKELGHVWYDLWGISPANTKGHAWDGITAFKQKFGGVELRLVPTLDYVYDESAYERYSSGLRVSPDVNRDQGREDHADQGYDQRS